MLRGGLNLDALEDFLGLPVAEVQGLGDLWGRKGGREGGREGEAAVEWGRIKKEKEGLDWLAGASWKYLCVYCCDRVHGRAEDVHDIRTR
jgi:hypothetical protein